MTLTLVPNVTPIMDDFKMRELLAHHIRHDMRRLLIATAKSVSKQPVCWSDVRALLPLPIDKSLALVLLAGETVIQDWHR
jgi:hypothetical protein